MVTYATSITPYARGRRCNSEEWNTITRTFETDAQLGFGVPVQRGTGDHGIVAWTSGDFLGVTEASLMLPHPGDYFVQYDNVPVCRMGVIGVLVSGSVADGDPAAWNGTAWGVADTTTETIFGEFDASGADGTIVPLRLMVPTTTVGL